MLKVALVLAVSPAAAGDLEQGWHVIRPVIHRTAEQKSAAMRSASVVVLAQIQATEVFPEPRMVEKPPEAGGPMVPEIPLHLARISAKRLISMRGDLPE